MKRIGKKGRMLTTVLLICACVFIQPLSTFASDVSSSELDVTDPAVTEASEAEDTTTVPDESEAMPSDEEDTTEYPDEQTEESSSESETITEEEPTSTSAEAESQQEEAEETATLYGANGVPDVRYWTHIQSYGWSQGWKKNGEEAGTHGQSKRLEGIYIEIQNQGGLTGGVRYQTHVQSYGWQGWKENGQFAGTHGQSKRLEGIRIELTGELAEYYDIYYCVHAQTFGWLDWAKNGEMSGTSGLYKRLEGIRIQLVPKNGPKPAPLKHVGRTSVTAPVATYQTHVQTYGTLDWVSDGITSGKIGQSKRMESLAVKITGTNMYGGIEYRTHVQSYGWRPWSKNGELNGTVGKAKRVEALQVRLTGEVSGVCDVYYRVYVEGYGWLGWAKNGETAGTSGLGLRVEAIEIKIIENGQCPVPRNQATYHEYTGPGYYQIGNQTRYYMANGAVGVGNGWVLQNGKRYYYDNGVPARGWRYIDGLKYYFLDDGSLCQNVDNIIGPQSSYVLKLNKQANCLTVYASDGVNGYVIPVKAMLCSTGDDTPLGTFHTPEKYRWRAMFNGTYAQFATRLTAGQNFLFHSVTYERPNNRTMIAYGYNGLGVVQSSGCIRLVCGEAYWLYTRCGLGTTVIVYESPTPGPFDRPVVTPIPEDQTWDPTDPFL